MGTRGLARRSCLNSVPIYHIVQRRSTLEAIHHLTAQVMSWRCRLRPRLHLSREDSHGDWSPEVVAPHHLDEGIDPSGAET